MGTSIYLPEDLKRQLVEVAEARGFPVGRGRKSHLARFVGALLRESKLLSQNNLDRVPIHLLIPELRSSLIELSKMGATRQERANRLLEILIDDWQEQETEHK
jgi:hypothetical protein